MYTNYFSWSCVKVLKQLKELAHSWRVQAFQVGRAKTQELEVAGQGVSIARKQRDKTVNVQ